MVYSVTLPQLFAGLFLYMIARGLVLQGGAYLLLPLLKSRRVDKRQVSWKQVRSELAANLISIFVVAAVFTGAIALHLAEDRATSIWPTFLTNFVWWEIWFYVSHRAMHLPKLFFIHRQHHMAQVTTPLTAISFSALEALILVIGGWGPMLLWQVWIPVSYQGLALFTLFHFAYSVYGHSNHEILPKFLTGNVISRNFWVTPTYHSLHHSKSRGNYGLFTVVLDKIFRTTCEDYGRPSENVHSLHISPIFRRAHRQNATVAEPAGHEKCS